MSGWLDFFEIVINCPFCNYKIEVTIWEDGDLYPEPVVISGLINGEATCPTCNKLISDDDLKDV
jgi:Zn ribbon nucleic-acid-binding protein